MTATTPAVPCDSFDEDVAPYHITLTVQSWSESEIEAGECDEPPEIDIDKEAYTLPEIQRLARDKGLDTAVMQTSTLLVMSNSCPPEDHDLFMNGLKKVYQCEIQRVDGQAFDREDLSIISQAFGVQAALVRDINQSPEHTESNDHDIG